MLFEVRNLINHGPGMFRRFEAGDALKEGPVVRVEAADEADALNMVWEVGNRVAVDADGKAWPSDVRSMSVGDVLVIGEAAWAVASFGFDRVEADALVPGLDPAKRRVHPAFRASDLGWAG